GRRGRSAKARSNHLITVVVYLALQHCKALLMSGLVRVDFCGPVESVTSFREIALLTIKIKQPQECGAVVGLAIRRVELVGKKLEHLDRTFGAGNNVLDHRQKGTALGLAGLEVLKFLSKSDSVCGELGIEQRADQVTDLLNPRRILLKDLPNEGSRLRQAIRAQKGLRIEVT